jgi:hypothetical protein
MNLVKLQDTKLTKRNQFWYWILTTKYPNKRQENNDICDSIKNKILRNKFHYGDEKATN